MRIPVLALALLLPASPALCSDPAIESGLDYIRSSGETGSAMSDYIQQDPVPIGFGEVPQGFAGVYRSEKKVYGDGKVEDNSRIVLDESLRSAPAKDVGNVLFHEYSHRLQDTGGGNLSHRPEDLDGAMDTLRDKTRPGSDRLDPLEDVRLGFDRQNKGEMGIVEAPVCPRLKAQFAMREFQSFRTSAQAAPAGATRRVFSGGVPRQSAVSGGAQAPEVRAHAGSSVPQPSRVAVRSAGSSRTAQMRQMSGGSRMRR